jgi:hypothetical protein
MLQEEYTFWLGGQINGRNRIDKCRWSRSGQRIDVDLVVPSGSGEKRSVNIVRDLNTDDVFGMVATFRYYVTCQIRDNNLARHGGKNHVFLAKS